LKKLTLLLLLISILPACNNLTKTTEQQVLELHEKILTVDSHTDTPLWLIRGFNLDERHDYRESRSRLDFPRMKEGGLDAVFMAAFIGQRERDSAGNERAIRRTTELIDSIHINVKKSPLARLAITPNDGYNIEKLGKRAVYIGIENGYAIGNDLEMIEYYYDRGVRYLTLCHTKNNDICDSSTDSTEHGGLSEFGYEVVKEMNRLGMMVDVSHISDESFYDVLETSGKPVIASHSCARAICDHPRNLDDEMLKALAENGGVIQMCILSNYVKDPEPYPERDSAKQAVRKKFRNFEDLTDEEMKQARIEWYAVDEMYPPKLASVSEAVDHIDHIVKVAGIDHVGIGTDFDGGGGLADCRDVSELGNITIELYKRGYSEEDIEKIWGKNIMRVMKENAM
jgi:membrane dipeptidase